MGRNWYQSASIALVLGHWTFFFNFKGPASWILQKMVLPPAQIISNVGKKWWSAENGV
jgi:hypothetical protein